MERTSDPLMHSTRPGYLAEVTLALLFIRDTRASGRLSLRNGEQFGITHLYFKEARLVHIAGDKGDGESILNDVLNWTKGSVRFDSGLQVTFESITWQQAQIFGRWLAFLEMRGMMQGITRERLDGLARSLMAQLPGEPIALPDVVEHHEEYEAAARAQQWQRINEGVQQLVDRALPEEQREQLKQVTRQLSQRMNQAVQQAGGATQDLAKRASKAAQNGLQRTVESMAETAQEVARQGTQRAEELVKQTLSRERRQQMLESTQRTVESMAEAAQEVARQGTQRAEELLRSPLPPELQAHSLRYRNALQPSSPAASGLSEGQ